MRKICAGENCTKKGKKDTIDGPCCPAEERGRLYEHKKCLGSQTEGGGRGNIAIMKQWPNPTAPRGTFQ